MTDAPANTPSRARRTFIASRKPYWKPYRHSSLVLYVEPLDVDAKMFIKDLAERSRLPIYEDWKGCYVKLRDLQRCIGWQFEPSKYWAPLSWSRPRPSKRAVKFKPDPNLDRIMSAAARDLFPRRR